MMMVRLFSRHFAVAEWERKDVIVTEEPLAGGFGSLIKLKRHAGAQTLAIEKKVPPMQPSSSFFMSSFLLSHSPLLTYGC